MRLLLGKIHAVAQSKLWGQLFNRPLAVMPDRAAELAAYLAGRGGVDGTLIDLQGFRRPWR